MNLKKKFSKIAFVLMWTFIFLFNSFALYNEFSPEKVLISEAGYKKSPKYVFYFIGDGLGASQRQISEYYVKNASEDEGEKLTINSFPVAGINTTYSLDTLVTDSAAAGTALATGHKTNNGMISVLPSGQEVKSLIEAAEEKGMGTGIITTTRLTHATPAVFASHNESRGNENEIAYDYVDSGVDFFAGGGYRHFVPKSGEYGKSKRTDDKDLVKEFKGLGYTTFIGEEDTEKFRKYRPYGERKVFAAFTYSHLPYEIDRVQTDSTPSLSEVTQKGIDVLSKYDDGFFMMVEGGRIDHACHANDAAGTIKDTVEFDNAVKKAYEFYQKHPKDTLILVVGDHETGGLGLGFAKNYFLNVDELEDVKVSVEDVLNSSNKYSGDRTSYFAFLEDKFSLENLTADEKALIESAMDMVDSTKDSEEPATTYGYDSVAIAATHVLSERANLQWTTYAHTATSIPLSAIGSGAEEFNGYLDNTQIAQKMFSLMKFKMEDK